MTESSTLPTTVPGARFYGTVTFDVRLPTSFCVHCHCSM
jgi:hypothetical protein